MCSLSLSLSVFQNGQTPLMVSAEQGNLEIVQELIRRGANVNLDDVVSMQTHTQSIPDRLIRAHTHPHTGTGGEIHRGDGSPGTGEKQCGHLNHIIRSTTRTYAVFHLAELTTLGLSPHLLPAAMSHNDHLLRYFTFTLLTKWQDPLVGQHPVSPEASPPAHAHTRACVRSPTCTPLINISRTWNPQLHTAHSNLRSL